MELILSLISCLRLLAYFIINLTPNQINSLSLTANPMNQFEVEAVEGSAISHLGEGPYWSEDQSLLYYVDAFVGDVHCYDAKTGVDSKVNLGDLVTIVIPIKDDKHLLVSLRNKVVKLNWATKTHEVIAEVAKDKAGKERFNDGKIDGLNRLWIGTVLEGPNGVVKGGGSLYKLENKQFVKMCSNITLSNGMAWNNNTTLMYFNDSEERITYLFDFDIRNGIISNQRVFLDYSSQPEVFASNEYPDGMAIDLEDFLWVSLYGGARIVRIDPQTAKVVASIHVPAPQTTSLAFGGANFTDIYVTTGAVNKEHTALQKKYPNSGKIFKIKTNFEGIKAFDFKA